MKIWKLLFASMVALVGLLLITPEIKADVSYEISRYNIDINVQKDGSLLIKRMLEYDFDNDSNGVYYRQNLSNDQKIKNLKVWVDQTPVSLSDSEADNTYKLTNDSDGYLFKVYHKNYGDSATFIYQYEITNAITNWKDTAELNFKVIGDGWDTDLNNIKITIHFPAKNISDLQAWTHGSLDGRTKVNRVNGTVTMTLDELPEETFVESHILFPAILTSDNQNIKLENRKQAVRNQEKKFAQEANEQRAKREKIDGIVYWVGMIIIVCLAIINILYNVLSRRTDTYQPLKTKNAPHVFDLPDYTAAEAQSFYRNRVPNNEALSAYLLELSRKKILKIEEIEKKFAKNDYSLTLINANSINDNQILDLLFNKIGDGHQVTIKQIKKYSKSRRKQEIISKAYKKWQNQVYKNMMNRDYISKDAEQIKKNHRIATIFLTILNVVIGIIIEIVTYFSIDLIFLIMTVSIILQLSSYLYFTKKHPIYTKLGADELTKLRGLYRMMKDIGRFNLKEVGDIVLWENILPYAVAFGLADKVSKALINTFTTEELANTNLIYYYPLLYNNSLTAFSDSFETSLNNGSSIGGNSGGFFGCNSGGFGGGSGGGAF